jgi:Glycoside hydrolase family 44
MRLPIFCACIVTLGVCASAATAAAESIALQVQIHNELGPISPLIYGINSNDHARRPFIPFTRQGGNRLTAYNWENNASNAGSDWHHQNDAFLGGDGKPGEVPRAFLANSLGQDYYAIITVPIAGYVAADKRGDGDVNATPDFRNKRFVKSFARKNGAFAYPPDLNDGAVYQDEFVWWLNREFPDAKKRIFYGLDNEPDLWDFTHARIRTQKLTYGELIQRTKEYAAAVKDVAPEAVVFGFGSYGYAGYLNLQNAPDAQGRDFIEFFLQQMKLAEKEAGRRLVDVLDLHWYPEARGGNVRVLENGSAETAKARMQAPRSLWDATYVEDSWIVKDVVHGPINLLPRIQAKIEKHYPGTMLALLEYNYGGGDDISGAIAEADALGIYGEQRLFAAALWAGGPFAFAGFDAYLNYDGMGGHYGDIAMATASSQVAEVAIHASRYSKDSTTVSLVLINRSEHECTCTLDTQDFAWKKGTAYRIEGSEAAVKPAGEIPNTGSLRLPALSVTILLLKK